MTAKVTGKGHQTAYRPDGIGETYTIQYDYEDVALAHAHGMAVVTREVYDEVDIGATVTISSATTSAASRPILPRSWLLADEAD